ncbi:MAG: hypothetical protein IPK69_10350 [Phycisphaerales bacterium]|nr:MAG: hypothetical protein IPK69_10350 [Phycisphaerales bacterium]
MQNMKQIILALVLLVALPGCDDPNAKSVRTAFNASLNATGEEVLNFYSKATFEQIERLAKIALKASRAEVQRLKPSDRLAVLQLRAQFNTTQLTKLSGRQLIAELGDTVWWADDEFPPRVTKVRATDEWANMDLEYRFSRRQKAKVTIRWVFEDNEWRVDDASMAAYQDRLVENFASDLGKSVDEAILYLIDDWYFGRGVPAAIWDRPVGGP